MKKTNYEESFAIKESVKLAFEEFKSAYKKVPRGITEIKTTIMLTNDLNKIKLLESKFFGYILKSTKAKKLKEELEKCD
jgi:DNA mismatch repair ATPase MutS